jgi:hypothetical protein
MLVNQNIEFTAVHDDAAGSAGNEMTAMNWNAMMAITSVAFIPSSHQHHNVITTSAQHQQASTVVYQCLLLRFARPSRLLLLRVRVLPKHLLRCIVWRVVHCSSITIRALND